MSTEPAQAEFGDGEDETTLLANFLAHLGRVAKARGAGVDGVMQGLIVEALNEFAKDYDDGK